MRTVTKQKVVITNTNIFCDCCGDAIGTTEERMVPAVDAYTAPASPAEPSILEYSKSDKLLEDLMLTYHTGDVLFPNQLEVIRSSYNMALESFKLCLESYATSGYITKDKGLHYVRTGKKFVFPVAQVVKKKAKKKQKINEAPEQPLAYISIEHMNHAGKLTCDRYVVGSDLCPTCVELMINEFAKSVSKAIATRKVMRDNKRRAFESSAKWVASQIAKTGKAPKQHKNVAKSNQAAVLL